MARKPPKGKSLAEVNPELSKQWHPTKNGDLTSFCVFAKSGIKVWWKCDNADSHDFLMSPNDRNRGRGCNICNRKIRHYTTATENSLHNKYPQLAKEWHPINNELTPKQVYAGGHTKYWWKCNKGEDHEWQSSISRRLRPGNCPVCSGQKVVNSNCLATTHPKLAKEWHPTKNGNLTPFDFTAGSSRQKIWWKCNKGEDHEWQSGISNRSRVNGSGCSICNGKKVVKSNCLATTNPETSKYWHPTKNKGITPFDVIEGSEKKVWWKCDKGEDHEWQSSVAAKKHVNCPVCAGRIVVKSNCLATTHPKLAKEWHPTKNGNLTPLNVVAGSHYKAWWKCNKGDDHEWIDTISHRKYGDRNCTICSNRKVVKSNCLAATHPKLAKEWHKSKNKISPNEIVAGSNEKYWWKCDKGSDHEWFISVSARAYNKNNCPFCTLTPQSKQELTITFELIQFFKDINPRGFKTRVNGKVRSIDIYIPKFHLGIEFDGSYWHKGKRALDKLKTKQLKKEGFDIIRVRETPLKKINRTDVISKQPFNGKEVANKVLKQIMKMYDLDAKKVRKIENYLDKKELQNEKGLDKYIDMILTEKAEKNN